MNTIIPFTICSICFILGFLLGRVWYKKPLHIRKGEQIAREAIESTKFINKLNPIVILIYNIFINSKDLSEFSESICGLIVHPLDIEIWAANEVENRRFFKVLADILKSNNQTINELNNSLSLADKMILDHIIKAIKKNNKEFIDRIFI